MVEEELGLEHELVGEGEGEESYGVDGRGWGDDGKKNEKEKRWSDMECWCK